MVTKRNAQQGGEALEDALNSVENCDAVKDLAKKTDERNSVDFAEIINILKTSNGSLTLKFPSAEGHHCITYAESGEFVGTYVGPFGPENRPASMSQEAIQQLWKHADNVTVEPTDQTRLDSSVVRDLV